ncbi:MAG: dihydroorotase [Armatimonadota bacterium]
MNGLLIKGGRLFDPASGLDAVGDLLTRNGCIAAIGDVTPTGAEEVIDAAGLWLLPGLIDLHVHLREPGQEYKETIGAGSRAAAAGGFTTIVCEPNTTPPCDTPERVERVTQLAKRDAVVQVLPKCAITLGQRGEQVTDLSALRRAGAVAASDDGFSVGSADVMRDAFARAKAAGMPLTVHVEGPAMVERDIRLAAEAGWPIHFSHISLAEEAELIARARSHRLPVTGEAAPHHLALCRDDAPADDASFKMNPPLASAADRAAIRSALAAGVLTVVASDHAPHSAQEKARGYDKAPAGVIGMETTLGVLWSFLAHPGRVTPEALVRAMTAGPAAVLGIAAPALREGLPADLVFFDPNRDWVVDPERFYSKARNCPFAGRKLQGRAVTTIRAGRIIMRENAIAN